MATQSKGILGEFSGKIGTVVGSNWRGKSYMRSLPTKRKNRKGTETQIIQQAKFGLGIRIVKSMASLLSISYQQVPGKTEKNVALSQILGQAMGGVYPDLFIDFSQVQVAKGSLKKADNPSVDVPASGTLRFNWSTAAMLGNASPLDNAILVAFCPETDDTVYSADQFTRSEGTGTLDVSYFSGKQVHTWISFRSADGVKTADSTFTGTILVP
jgi:hypothetical protein